MKLETMNKQQLQEKHNELKTKLADIPFRVTELKGEIERISYDLMKQRADDFINGKETKTVPSMQQAETGLKNELAILNSTGESLRTALDAINERLDELATTQKETAKTYIAENLIYKMEACRNELMRSASRWSALKMIQQNTTRQHLDPAFVIDRFIRLNQSEIDATITDYLQELEDEADALHAA